MLGFSEEGKPENLEKTSRKAKTLYSHEMLSSEIEPETSELRDKCTITRDSLILCRYFNYMRTDPLELRIISLITEFGISMFGYFIHKIKIIST